MIDELVKGGLLKNDLQSRQSARNIYSKQTKDKMITAIRNHNDNHANKITVDDSLLNAKKPYVFSIYWQTRENANTIPGIGENLNYNTIFGNIDDNDFVNNDTSDPLFFLDNVQDSIVNDDDYLQILFMTDDDKDETEDDFIFHDPDIGNWFSND